jgi:hypothetical protein
MRKTLFAFAILASALSIPLTAHADTIDQLTFNFSRPGFLPADAIIDIPASPPPSYLNGLFGFCPASDCITVLGTSPTGSNYYLVNFAEVSPTQTSISYAYYGSLDAPIPPARAFYQIYGLPALFTGPVSAPTFLNGTFDGEYQAVVEFPPIPGTLTIEPINNPAVPEPSTLTLMATGLLGAITTLKHRKSRPGS